MTQSLPESNSSTPTDILETPARRTIRQFEPWLGEEEKQAVADAVASGWLNEHERTRQFERTFAEYVGAKYAAATTSGTTAIFLALASQSVGPGDEVIVPDYTFIATANAVRLTGATPVFCDVRNTDGNLDVNQVLTRITKRTKAIIPVHINGRFCDVDALKDAIVDRGLESQVKIIEDASQTLGSRHNGKHLGTFGEIGCFSLATTKIITTGQGGVVVTDDKDLYLKAVRLKDQGRADRLELKAMSDHHEHLGFNFKFTELQAALGLAQFKKLNWRVQRMKQIYEVYKEELFEKRALEFPELEENETPWYVDIMFDRPRLNQLVQREMKTQYNIETRLFYKPLHQQPVYRLDERYPVAEDFSARGLWLPSSSFLSDEDITWVCDCIRRILS